MASSVQDQLAKPLFAPLQREFCSYCGYPPVRRSRGDAARVCNRCNLGMVLRTAAHSVPRQDALFLIVNQNLLVQGVSRGAEAVLLVDEPDAVNTPLAELLTPGNGNASWGDLAELITLAVAEQPSDARIDLRTADHPLVWFAGRVSSCGLPPAALVLLTPLRTRALRSVGAA